MNNKKEKKKSKKRKKNIDYKTTEITYLQKKSHIQRKITKKSERQERNREHGSQRSGNILIKGK